ncbi:MAG: O-antigen ligase family protein, partial [Nitrospira sp.]|nr:O-antigen ligase family protein [Nitrospira sp.]
MASGWTGVFAGITLFAPLIDGGSTHLPVLIIHWLLLVGLGLWLIRSFDAGALVVKREPLLILVGIFLGIALGSILATSYLEVTLHGIGVLSMYALCVFLLLHIPRPQRSTRLLIGLILGMGLLEGTIGIVQYVWLAEPRAKGTFFNPNFFAIYETVSVALAFGLLIAVRREEWNLGTACFVGASLAVSFCGFVMAQSRGAVVAMLTALLVIAAWKSWRLALLISFVLLAIVVAVPNPIKHRTQAVAAQDPYAFTRFAIWENSLRRIADHPLGTGLGTYKYLSFQYRFPVEGTVVRYGKRAESAHNGYLQMGVELGLGGLIMFLVGIGLWAGEVIAALRNPLLDWERGAVVGLSGGVLALLIHAVVDSVFHEPALVLLLIVCGGLALSFRQPTRPPMRIPCVRTPVLTAAAVVVCAILGVVL